MPIIEMTAQQLMYAADNVKKLDSMQIFAKISLKLGN